MRRAVLSLVAGLLTAALLTSCSAGDAAGSAAGPAKTPTGDTIGVLLPDTNVQRWTKDDPRYLKAAFDEAGIKVDIQNAEGDRDRFVSIAEKMIADGARVLIVVSPDQASGKKVLGLARAAGVKTIDYDRLTLGGRADYYVSFDNEEVGRMMGQGLTTCLGERKAGNPVVAELNGSPTDYNATLYKNGYDSVLGPLFNSAAYTKGPDQWVPDWQEGQAGALFEQMLDQQPKIAGVLAANDGIAGAVISALRKRKRAGQVPVTGQDATIQGLQYMLTGDQCMTVYKPIKAQADAAAGLAAALFRGEKPAGEDSKQFQDPDSGVNVPFVELTPQLIFKKDIKVVLDDKFVARDELCAGKYEQLCKEAGL